MPNDALLLNGAERKDCESFRQPNVVPQTRGATQSQTKLPRLRRVAFSCLLSVFFCWPALAYGWVHGHQPFPEGEAEVVFHVYCTTTDCPGTSALWRSVIRHAADEWHDTGTAFRFLLTPARERLSRDPCTLRGVVVVILADPGTLCPGSTGDLPRDGKINGRTEYLHGGAQVYLQRTERPLEWGKYQRMLIHEFGHVLGLGHPDSRGFFERAIMNSYLSWHSPDTGWVTLWTVQDDDREGALALYGRAQETAQMALEAPREGQTCTGVGIIRGWACEAQNIAVSVNGGPRIPTATGNPRGDTRATCGHEDTGFVLLVNWNNFGPGMHTLEVFTDGRLTVTRTVEVITFGEPFLRNLDGEWTLQDWPEPGTDTVVAWNEAAQNIEIVDIDRREPEPEPERPTTGPAAPLLGTWTLTSPVVTVTLTIDRLEGSGPYQNAKGRTSHGHPVHAGTLSGGNVTHLISWSDGQTCHGYSLRFPTPSTMAGDHRWARALGGGHCADQWDWISFTGQRH